MTMKGGMITMSEENTQRILYEFKKNATELVRIGVSEYKGREYAFIRIFYNANSMSVDEPEWRPTKKGVVVNIDLVPEVIKGFSLIGS